LFEIKPISMQLCAYQVLKLGARFYLLELK
jgi:hypothetical protein